MHSLPRTAAIAVVVATAALFPRAAIADFPVAYTTAVESAPSVAHDSSRDGFAVAYLRHATTSTLVEVRRFDADGAQVGSVIEPFGTGIDAISRPQILYNPDRDEYLVVVIGAGVSKDVVAVRRIDGNGNVLVGPDFLFTGRTYLRMWDPRGVGAVRAAYDSLLAEFVVTAQLDTGPPGSPQRGLWGQRFTSDTGSFVGEVKLTPSTDLQVWSHAIAYAPVPSSLWGGHFLLAYSWDTHGESRVALFDAYLADIVHPIPFDWGSPAGEAGYADAAFGTVEGQPTFLVVWSDGDNRVGDPPQDWTGIWASHLDPARTTYDSYPDNAPFPVSYIDLHVGSFQRYKPRVAASSSAETFFVAWHEEPTNDPVNSPDLCSHIRGAWVDYLDFDWRFHPYANQVISDVTCDCLPPPEGPPNCASLEDPRMPDVAPIGSGSAVAVWQQDYPPAPADQDVIGDRFGHPLPANDAWTSPAILPGVFTQTDCMLLGATLDGAASCGGSGEPDVWYKFTAPSHGVLFVNTCGTHDMFGPDGGMDTVVSLHEPVHADQIAPQACNDDWPSWDPSGGCSGADQGTLRDSFMDWPMVAGESFLIRLSRYPGTTGGRCLLTAGFAEGAGGAGHVPDDGHFGGNPLRVTKGVGGDLMLTWDPSCNSGDADYEVYGGILGWWYSHEPITCDTGGATSFTFPVLNPGSEYFLVVPHNGMFEGSHGLDGFGAERPPGLISCRPHNPNPCP